jgi:hypothetical protein
VSGQLNPIIFFAIELLLKSYFTIYYLTQYIPWLKF